MNKQSIRIILIALGLLDLLSFYRTHNTALTILHGLSSWRIYPILEFLLIMSLLASGILFILGKRASFVLYYIQFPLKLGFMILTFGFILSLLGMTGMANKILLGFVIGLETVRLFLTIWINRKHTA